MFSFVRGRHVCSHPLFLLVQFTPFPVFVHFLQPVLHSSILSLCSLDSCLVHMGGCFSSRILLGFGISWLWNVLCAYSAMKERSGQIFQVNKTVQLLPRVGTVRHRFNSQSLTASSFLITMSNFFH